MCDGNHHNWNVLGDCMECRRKRCVAIVKDGKRCSKASVGDLYRPNEDAQLCGSHNSKQRWGGGVEKVQRVR